MSDDDEFQQKTLTPEEMQEVIMWAIRTSGTIVLMYHDDTTGTEDKLGGYEMAVEAIYDGIPECFADVAYAVANSTLEEAQQTEEIIEKFREEIADL